MRWWLLAALSMMAAGMATAAEETARPQRLRKIVRLMTSGERIDNLVLLGSSGPLEVKIPSNSISEPYFFDGFLPMKFALRKANLLGEVVEGGEVVAEVTPVAEQGALFILFSPRESGETSYDVYTSRYPLPGPHIVAVQLFNMTDEQALTVVPGHRQEVEPHGSGAVEFPFPAYQGTRIIAAVQRDDEWQKVVDRSIVLGDREVFVIFLRADKNDSDGVAVHMVQDFGARKESVGPLDFDPRRRQRRR